MLRTAFAFIAAPLVGSIAGGFAMGLAVPGPAAMFSLMYVLFGGLIAFGATLAIGVPLVYALRRKSRPVLPSLLAAALGTGVLVVVALQCLLSESGCSLGSIHNVVFGLVSAVATAIVLSQLLPPHNAA